MRKDIELTELNIWVCGKCKNKNDIYLIKCGKCGKNFIKDETNEKNLKETETSDDGVTRNENINKLNNGKIISLVISLIIIFGLFLIFTIIPWRSNSQSNTVRSERIVDHQRQAASENNFDINEHGGIIGYRGKESSLSIPAQINGKFVYSVWDKAFYDIGLTSVAISDNITSIGNSAFRKNNITSVTIGSNVSLGIGDYGDSFDDDFVYFYITNGRKGGSYIYNNGQWMESAAEVEISSNFNRTIELTDPRVNGQDILKLQNRLLSLGFNEIGIADGYYGPATAGAIKKIQTFSGLESNGIVDKSLWVFIFYDRNILFMKNISGNIPANIHSHSEVESYFSKIIDDFDSMNLEKRDLYADAEMMGDAVSPVIFYSPTDRKIKIFKDTGGSVSVDITSTYYFINETYYLIKYCIHSYNTNTSEITMYLVNDDITLEFENNVLRQCSSLSDYSNVYNGYRKHYQEYFDMILDKNGTVLSALD